MKKSVKNKYTVTEVGTLIEALRSEFRPLLEQIPGIKSKLDSVHEQVGLNTEKIMLLETAIKGNSAGIKGNRQLITENRELINRVLEELKSKVDRKDFNILEKKVASLCH